MPFTVDEITIISLFCDGNINMDKNNFIKSLIESIPLTSEIQIKDIMESVVSKVTDITQDEFIKIDLSSALIAEE